MRLSAVEKNARSSMAAFFKLKQFNLQLSNSSIPRAFFELTAKENSKNQKLYASIDWADRRGSFSEKTLSLQGFVLKDGGN